jgi:hypothetical protein
MSLIIITIIQVLWLCFHYILTRLEAIEFYFTQTHRFTSIPKFSNKAMASIPGIPLTSGTNSWRFANG